jgi:hypothetical protein
VHGAPVFKIGEEDVLFVRGNGVQANPLVAFAYGRYPIVKDKQAGRIYVTRSNGELLYDEEEVTQLLESTGVRRLQRANALPVTIGDFTSKIREFRKSRIRP